MAPRSVAVIGASSDPSRIGGKPIHSMLRAGFEGAAIYPVNPHRSEIQGLKAYASIAQLPQTPDAAIVAVPSNHVQGTIAELAERGVAGAVVFSAGFAETGEAGAQAQAQLVATARRHGMRLLGPNCLGLFNARARWYSTFTTAFDMGGFPLDGRVAIVSQSGAFGSYLFSLARDRGMGTPLWITTGNEADVSVGEAIQWCVQDPDIDVIVAYAEGIKDSASFVAALDAARKARKPVVMMKVGRSAIGHRAAQSHTASVAGDDKVTSAVLAEFGAVRAFSTEALLDIAYAATRRIYPTGNSLGVLTISGGVGVQISDAAEDCDLPMPPMSQAAQDKLRALIPYCSPANPVDCTAQAVNEVSLVSRFAQEVAAQPYKSIIGFFAQAAGASSVAPVLLKALQGAKAAHPDKLFALVGTVTPDIASAYDDAGILLFSDVNRAVSAISAMGRLGEAFDRGALQAPPVVAPVALPALQPSEAQAKALLVRIGIAAPPEQVASSAREAAQMAAGMGFPVVLKIVSPDIAHKTEIGGVLLGVQDEEQARQGFQTLIDRAQAKAPQARLQGVLVARQLSGGTECILGVHRDPVFGPVAMFGLGGIFVEMLKDVSLRRCPFGEDVALEMIASIQAAGILNGARNLARRDVQALAAMLSRLSVFAHQAGPRLRSVELNPVAVLNEGQGAFALDALLDIEESP